MSSSLNNCKRPHQIEVEQLKDADRVEHSLLLVKGRLLPHCANASELQAKLIVRRNEHEQRTQLSAGGGEFKLLFELAQSGQEEEEEEEENETEQDCQLLLRCCNGERRLRFSYRPRRSAYRVQPLYLLCRSSEHEENDDEQEAESPGQQQQRCAQIDLNLRLVQCIYAHKLHAAGHPNRTFSLHSRCRIFRSQLSCTQARALRENALWQHFAGEIISSAEWAEQLQLKFVAFVGCTRYDGAAVKASGDYSYANIRRHLHAHAALGGGGLALFGTGHFYAWPRNFAEIGDCIRSTQRVDVTRQPDESNYRRTYGGVYASTLGAVCHELGHCFDLGHTLDGVMGRGFDYLNRVLTVDQPTEHLPQRIVSAANVAATAAAGPRPRPRFTPLKLKQSASNQFLDNYHAQRLNDSFFFADNCAIILAQHRWLRPDTDTLSKPNLELHIQLLPASRELVSNVALRLIELRCNLNSLVAHYEVFEEATTTTHRWQLPDALWQLLATQRTHYVFVLTLAGDTKRLSWDGDVKLSSSSEHKLIRQSN